VTAMSDIVPLLDLAAAINAEHAAALEHARSAVQRARRAGELLLEAKEQCAYGEWLSWLKDRCPDVSERQAQRYMLLARACLESPEKAAELEALTLRGALESLKSDTVSDLAAAPRKSVAELVIDARLEVLTRELERITAEHDRDRPIMRGGLPGHMEAAQRCGERLRLLDDLIDETCRVYRDRNELLLRRAGFNGRQIHSYHVRVMRALDGGKAYPEAIDVGLTYLDSLAAEPAAEPA